ncbi:hypothetical protein D3C80_1629260 [compost metagenome]
MRILTGDSELSASMNLSSSGPKNSAMRNLNGGGSFITKDNSFKVKGPLYDTISIKIIISLKQNIHLNAYLM